MNKTGKSDVFMSGRHVGTLASTPSGCVAFQYTPEWMKTGFAINPLSLPLEDRVFVPDWNPFDGLFGVFSDSLPDGWGRLITDRYLASQGWELAKVDEMDRLAYIGETGMGALSYRPKAGISSGTYSCSYDEIEEKCREFMQSGSTENLDELFSKGGSSGGARPKVLTEIDGEDWIIKFPSSYDDNDIGLQEYQYSLCAKACGIPMTETRIFKSSRCAGYFGTRRFDRAIEDGIKKRIHTVSVSGLLETSHGLPNLDYNDLMKLTMILTRDIKEVKKLYRMMCFNVFAHNRDDHSRNFSYIYREDERKWELSPAYDLTYSSSIGGEHATTIDGEGRDPDISHILAVAKKAGISEKWAVETAKEIQESIKKALGKYL